MKKTVLEQIKLWRNSAAYVRMKHHDAIDLAVEILESIRTGSYQNTWFIFSFIIIIEFKIVSSNSKLKIWSDCLILLSEIEKEEISYKINMLSMSPGSVFRVTWTVCILNCLFIISTFRILIELNDFREYSKSWTRECLIIYTINWANKTNTIPEAHA